MVKHRNVFVEGSMKKGVNDKLANDFSIKWFYLQNIVLIKATQPLMEQ